jgi:hypothetical protein
MHCDQELAKMKRNAEAIRRVQANVRAVADWTPRHWATWLFAVLRTGDEYPLDFSRFAEPLDELEAIFEHAGESVRSAMKDGVIKAIHEWDRRYHGYGVLQQLSNAAARLRASDAIHDLADFLMRNRTRLERDEDFFEVADSIIAVLAGFAPDPIIEKVFNALLFDDKVSPRLSGLLSIGLTMSNRKRFPAAFDRFIDRRKLDPTFFDDDQVVTEYAHFMGPRGLAEEARHLQLPAQQYLYSNLAKLRLVNPEVFIGWDGGEGHRHGDLAGFDDREEPTHLTVRYDAERIGIEARVKRRRSQTLGHAVLSDIAKRINANPAATPA